MTPPAGTDRTEVQVGRGGGTVRDNQSWIVGFWIEHVHGVEVGDLS